ncbi:GntR family transcriptional regulator [Gordonia sp. CPCC 206044]|uniref:GntR family transcriptional regulator n=1 Tax=Gordonia sp. CPCC 206044 TaxID=3140793 RepID=UPI003AF38264
MYVEPDTRVVRRGNAVEDTYRTLRERIISGQYRPGVSLSQVRLADEFAVSRTPLREALRRLEAENLVISQANRGVIVAPIGLEDVEGSYAIRLLVEPALLSAIVPEVSDDDLADMADALDRMQRTTVSPTDFQVAHWEFHRVMLARFPLGVRTMIEEHLTVIDRHQRLYFQRPAVVDDLTGVDEQLLDAIRAHEPRRARGLLEFHLLDTALGVITAVETAHEFSALPIALAGIGIETGDFGRLDDGLPVPVAWTHESGSGGGPGPLHTSNLYSTGETPP